MTGKPVNLFAWSVCIMASLVVLTVVAAVVTLAVIPW